MAMELAPSAVDTYNSPINALTAAKDSAKNWQEGEIPGGMALNELIMGAARMKYGLGSDSATLASGELRPSGRLFSKVKVWIQTCSKGFKMPGTMKAENTYQSNNGK